MNGKWIAAMIIGAAALAGGALYYFQIYYFYENLPAESVEISLTERASGAPQTIPVAGLQAIDASSSPIRFRACFDTPLSLADLRADFLPYEAAEPLTAPQWFDCFDAAALGADLEAGRAAAFLGVADIRYGIDLVVAVDDAGRGYAWHQINHCGEKVFDGEPVPAGCPPPPDPE